MSRVRPKDGPAEAFTAQLGDDHPSYLVNPTDLPAVALDVEDSVHYDLGTPDAFDDWDAPIGFHDWYELGPRMHAYTPTMAHDLHCLTTFHDALYSRNPEATPGHVQHCLNYLRQMILCDPDLTLEDADALEVDHYLRPGGTAHVCRDWTAVWRESERARTEWVAFIKAHWAPLDEKQGPSRSA